MELKLPDTIGGKRDLILATRQVEQILSDRLQDEVRQKYGAKKVGTKSGQDMLNALLETNSLRDDTQTLKKLAQQLEGIKQHAKQVRVLFSQEPDQDLYKRTVSWFRTNIDPGVLVQIGVQPAIGGGFILQTPARRYDFTLKTKIMSSTPKFVEILNRTKDVAPAPAPQAVEEAAAPAEQVNETVAAAPPAEAPAEQPPEAAQ